MSTTLAFQNRFGAIELSPPLPLKFRPAELRWNMYYNWKNLE
jgi:hypothetical protein